RSVWNQFAVLLAFFLDATATTCTLSLHDALPISQKSPIFCASLPCTAFEAADCSLIARRLTYSCSLTSLPIPQLASDAGMGCFFSQPPLAYWKKSTAGLTVVSRLAARKSVRAGPL